uniref:Uncharacterized protein n=1 Tax=Pseudonaja textilis TaxID=8673 RepID=A0A670ZKN2_PSETE
MAFGTATRGWLGWVGAITASGSLFQWPLWVRAGGTWKAKLGLAWLFRLAGGCAPTSCFPSSAQPTWLWCSPGEMSGGPSGEVLTALARAPLLGRRACLSAALGNPGEALLTLPSTRQGWWLGTSPRVGQS